MRGWLTHVVRTCWSALRWPVTVAVVAAVLYSWHMMEPFELITQDIRFLLRGYQLATSDVVVVGITEETNNLFGEKMPRSNYAKVIDYLHGAGAKAICFDVNFRAPSVPAEDDALAAAIERAGNVVLPVYCGTALPRYTSDPIRRVDSLKTNLPLLTEKAAAVGHINISLSHDGKCRAVPIALEHEGNVYWFFGDAAAQQFLEKSPDDHRKIHRPPGHQNGEYLINYSGQHVTFDFKSFHEVLAGKFHSNMFQNKLVLIGQAALGHADIISTPLGATHGVFVHATVIDNILTGNFLRRQSPLSVMLTVLLASCLTALLFSFLRPAMMIVVLVAVGVIFSSISLLLFNRFGYVFDLMPPMFVLAVNFAVAVGINLKTVHAAVQRKDTELSTLFRSSQVVADDINSQLDTVQLLVNIIGQTVGVEWLTLAWNDHARVWIYRNHTIDKPSLTVEQVRSFEEAANPWLMQRGVPYLVTYGDPGNFLIENGLHATSFLSAPLLVRHTAVGVLNFYNKLPSPVLPDAHFEEDDLRLIGVLARQVAMHLENLHLINTLETRNYELLTANQQLNKAQEALIQKERLSAVGQMASMIMHDIRGPLTAAVGYANLLKMTDTGDPSLQEYTQGILEQIKRINSMAQEVLDYATGTSNLAFETLTANRLVEDLIDRLGCELDYAKIELLTDIDCTDELRVDRDKLLRVLMNLSRNAVEAMNGSGTLRISGKTQNGSVLLQISDSGPGIAPEMKEKLFHPFVTSGKKQGVGLGLAIAKKIIEDHGGTISAESVEGQGATFKLYLPRARKNE